MDTIFALSSGMLPAGVAVIRVSGPRTRYLVESVSGEAPAPRTLVLRSIRDRNGQIVDRGLVVWFAAPESFTGEDCAEFHVHGGRAVVDRIYDVLAGFERVRVAEPGEFSRRAFVNGKIDLTEAEGLADLIAAETEAQRQLAVAQSSGSLRRLYETWRDQLLHARAMIEAEIDFADEEDVPGSVSGKVWAEMAELRDALARHIAGARTGSAIREGFRIAIVGAPNAGKSSLLNALAGSDVAIVSEEPGTTRDAIEVRMVIGGTLSIVTDTAGIREAKGAVEAEGIRRSFLRASEADLILHLSDRGTWEKLPSIGDAPVWRVASKSDQGAAAESAVPVSVRSVDGLGPLLSRLEEHVSRAVSRDQLTLPTRKRHLAGLQRALSDIREALDNTDDGLEIRAELLRRAADSMGAIVGHTDVEDILGVIFSEFCVGK